MSTKLQVDLRDGPLADADHTYTTLKGPTAWMAPETFDENVKGQIVSPASDVYMLGSCFVEIAPSCTRAPFDWLAGQRIFLFRGHETSRATNCIQVHWHLFVSAANLNYYDKHSKFSKYALSFKFKLMQLLLYWLTGSN